MINWIKQNKIFSILVMSVLFLSFASATFKSDFEKELNSEIDLPVLVPQDYCSSFLYKFFSNYLNGFSIQMVEENTEETFYLILYVQEKCIWDIDIKDSYSRADITVTGNLDSGEEPKIKSNTLKGFFIKNKIKELLL